MPSDKEASNCKHLLQGVEIHSSCSGGGMKIETKNIKQETCGVGISTHLDRLQGWRLVGQLMWHQFIVGATGGAALGLAFVKPEPNHCRVVLLTCKEEKVKHRYGHVSDNVP